MTIALCLNCGDLKFGSLTICKSCGEAPQGFRQRSYSMILSDHYFEQSQLEEYSAHMKEGNPHPELSPEQEKKIFQQFASVTGYKGEEVG